MPSAQAKSCDELGCHLRPDSASRRRPDRCGLAGGRACPRLSGDPTSKGDSVALPPCRCSARAGSIRPQRALGACYPPNRTDETSLAAIASGYGSGEAPFILDRLTSAPQTNEVRRWGALLPRFPHRGTAFRKAVDPFRDRRQRRLESLGTATATSREQPLGDAASPVSIAPGGRSQRRLCDPSK